jgi:hypothetical protein
MLVFILNDFCGIPANKENWIFFDPSDPPQFESQASYLRRHGRLTPAETEALKDQLKVWQPEILNFTT